MDQNAWIMLFVGIALSAGLFALGVVLYPKLKREEQGYPLEAAIEAALLPVIFEGICAGKKIFSGSLIEEQIKKINFMLHHCRCTGWDAAII